MAKIEGVQPIESAFGQTQVSGTPTAATPVDGAANGGAQTAGASLGPQTITVVQQPDLGDFRQLPPPVPSPYSNAEYRARDRGLWDMWDFNRRY